MTDDRFTRYIHVDVPPAADSNSWQDLDAAHDQLPSAGGRVTLTETDARALLDELIGQRRDGVAPDHESWRPSLKLTRRLLEALDVLDAGVQGPPKVKRSTYNPPTTEELLGTGPRRTGWTDGLHGDAYDNPFTDDYDRTQYDAGYEIGVRQR